MPRTRPRRHLASVLWAAAGELACRGPCRLPCCPACSCRTIAPRPSRRHRSAQRVVLLHFVYTTCSTTCPTQVRELAALHDGLSQEARANIRFLSVSVDPLSDTPATLSAFARRMGADRPGWIFATGRPEQVQALVERMQAMAPGRQRPAPQDHRSSLYLFDASGELVQRFSGVPVDRPRLAAEMNRLVAAKARATPESGPPAACTPRPREEEPCPRTSRALPLPCRRSPCSPPVAAAATPASCRTRSTRAS